MIVVAKKIYLLQLFISRMPKMCAIPQLVSAPLNPIPIVEHFRRSHPQREHSYGQHIYIYKSLDCIKHLDARNTSKRFCNQSIRILFYIGHFADLNDLIYST